jgi:hypothetical protein
MKPITRVKYHPSSPLLNCAAFKLPLPLNCCGLPSSSNPILAHQFSLRQSDRLAGVPNEPCRYEMVFILHLASSEDEFKTFINGIPVW